IPNKTDRLLPPRPKLRPLKCIWDGRVTLKKLYKLLSRVLELPSYRDGESPLLEEYFSCQWGTSYYERVLVRGLKWDFLSVERSSYAPSESSVDRPELPEAQRGRH